MNIGENIKRARQERGMTQAQLAEAIEITQKDVSRWENGSRKPSLEKFVQICKALGASSDDILEINTKK